MTPSATARISASGACAAQATARAPRNVCCNTAGCAEVIEPRVGRSMRWTLALSATKSVNRWSESSRTSVKTASPWGHCIGHVEASTMPLLRSDSSWTSRTRGGLRRCAAPLLADGQQRSPRSVGAAGAHDRQADGLQLSVYGDGEDGVLHLHFVRRCDDAKCLVGGICEQQKLLLAALGVEHHERGRRAQPRPRSGAVFLPLVAPRARYDSHPGRPMARGAANDKAVGVAKVDVAAPVDGDAGGLAQMVVRLHHL
eukprot:2254851-Prymnesium_polylepis.1